VLKFSLDKILKDKNENISELSRQTGLSRKTLTQLANNDSKGIQLNTLQKLMEHFDLPVESFFVNHLQDVYASIIDFDTKKITLPFKIDSIDGRLKILQIVIRNDDTEKNSYYGYPIILVPLNSDDKNSNLKKEQENEIWGFTVLDLDSDSFNNQKKLPNDLIKIVDYQNAKVNNVLSHLNDKQIFTLFFTALLTEKVTYKVSDRFKESGSMPFMIDCFGIKKIDFLNIKKLNNGEYTVTLPEKLLFNNDDSTNQKLLLHILKNTDLTTWFK